MAEVEAGHLEHDALMLETERIGVVAEINTLLHRAPDAALPAPPVELPAPAMPPDDPARLAELAIARRPQRAAA
ncbi:hypothetical protein, partial [Streptomyces brasiliscabiei]|uniref:hypothetical protein n=1 Tax=Streptomyces brasiliscabiei TaxID=2736302 RepID=UPI0030157861